MEILTLLGVAAVAVYAFLVHQKVKQTAERIDRINDRLYSWGGEARTAIEELRGQVRWLEIRQKRGSGKAVVSSDMLISDILSIHPRMKDVLASMHLGGCSSCHVSEAETLAEGVASYDLDLEAIMVEIEKFLEDPDGYVAEPKPHGGSGQRLQIKMPENAGPAS